MGLGPCVQVPTEEGELDDTTAKKTVAIWAFLTAFCKSGQARRGWSTGREFTTGPSVAPAGARRVSDALCWVPLIISFTFVETE